MSVVRPPLVAGVAGGVGTTTVAAALQARDRGVFTGRAVDVLVCRGTSQSLLAAAGAARCLRDAAGLAPVLAVTADGPSAPTKPITARLGLVEPHTAAVVLLPYVSRWREVPAPLDELGSLLAQPAGELPRPLREFAQAVRALAAAMLATGRLHPPGPARAIARPRDNGAPTSDHRLLRGANP